MVLPAVKYGGGSKIIFYNKKGGFLMNSKFKKLLTGAAAALSVFAFVSCGNEESGSEGRTIAPVTFNGQSAASGAIQIAENDTVRLACETEDVDIKWQLRAEGDSDDMYDKLISKAKRSGIKVFANEELGDAIGVDVSTSTDHMDNATKQFLSLNFFYPQNFIFALDKIQQEKEKWFT